MTAPYERPSDPAKRRSAELTDGVDRAPARAMLKAIGLDDEALARPLDRKSTRLNSSHRTISYAVFCLKKKKKT